MNPPPATLPSLRAQLFAATWLSYAGFYFCRKVFGVVRGPLRDALGRDDLAVSHLWTVFLLSYMLGQFVTAALGRRLPARQILIGGMLASAATTWAAGAVLGPGRTRYLLLLLAFNFVLRKNDRFVGWYEQSFLATTLKLSLGVSTKMNAFAKSLRAAYTASSVPRAQTSSAWLQGVCVPK